MLTKNQSMDDVMDVDAASPPTLSVSVAPRHDVVGTSVYTMSTTQTCTTIAAGQLPDDVTERAAVDVVGAIDISCSMAGEKLEMCKKNLELLIRQLLPHDRFGLVSFAEEAVIEIPVRKLTAKNKAAALQKIASLSVRGGTNISAAIGLAAHEIRAVETPNEVRSVFLLTDGQANRGISSSEGIANVAQLCFAQPKNDGSPPITVHCFGYGTHHDDKLLTAVSEVTHGGTYYFVEKDANLATAFGDALGGILSVVAQSVVVNIHIPPEAAQMGVYIGGVHHEHQVKREDGSYSVPVGDFYAEESRDVLVDVKLASPPVATLTPIPHIVVSLSYMDTIKKQLVTTDPVTCAIARPPGLELSEPNRHVVLQWLRVYSAQEIAQAEAMSHRGDLACARTKIRRCKEYIHAEQDSRLRSDPLVLQLLFDLDNAMGGLASHERYVTYGSKVLSAARQSHALQRSSVATPESPSVYRTPKRRRIRRIFASLSVTGLCGLFVSSV